MNVWNIYVFSISVLSSSPTTVSISLSSCSSTSGFCLSSSSMKKRLTDRVSGAAITISSTHCTTLSADSSPWFWEHVNVNRRWGGRAPKRNQDFIAFTKEMAETRFSDWPVQRWVLWWSWCCPVYRPAPRLSSSAPPGPRWHHAAPCCEITDILYLAGEKNNLKNSWRSVSVWIMKWERGLTLPPCASGGSSPAWSTCLVWLTRFATCQNTSGSSPAALSLHTESSQHRRSMNSLSFILTEPSWWTQTTTAPVCRQQLQKEPLIASSPLTGTSRKSRLEMSTTVQRSKLRTSTWAKLSRSSRWVCVEETQTSTVFCKPGPVRAETDTHCPGL